MRMLMPIKKPIHRHVDAFGECIELDGEAYVDAFCGSIELDEEEP